MKRIITFGTFDLYHIGHVRLLDRASELGNELIVGDWDGKFNEFKDICEVVYLPRTPEISTTELLERITATILSNHV